MNRFNALIVVTSPTNDFETCVVLTTPYPQSADFCVALTSMVLSSYPSSSSLLPPTLIVEFLQKFAGKMLKSKTNVAAFCSDVYRQLLSEVPDVEAFKNTYPGVSNLNLMEGNVRMELEVKILLVRPLIFEFVVFPFALFAHFHQYRTVFICINTISPFIGCES